MAHFEKVPTGDASQHNGLRSQFASSPAHWAADSGTGQSRAGLGAWPVAFHAGASQTLLCF